MKIVIPQDALTSSESIIKSSNVNDLKAASIKLSEIAQTDIKNAGELINQLIDILNAETDQSFIAKVPVLGGLFKKLFRHHTLTNPKAINDIVDKVLAELEKHKSKLQESQRDLVNAEARINEKLTQANQWLENHKQLKDEIDNTDLNELYNTDFHRYKRVTAFLENYQTIITIKTLLEHQLANVRSNILSINRILKEIEKTQAFTKETLGNTLLNLAAGTLQQHALQVISNTRRLHEVALKTSAEVTDQNLKRLKEIESTPQIAIEILKQVQEQLKKSWTDYENHLKVLASKLNESIHNMEKLKSSTGDIVVKLSDGKEKGEE
jgi:chromosome segregation ATPase